MFDIVWRAFILSVSWMGTSLLSVAVTVIIPLAIFFIQTLRQGWPEARKRIRENVKDTTIATIGIWLILIGISAIYIAHEIDAQADAVHIPFLRKPHPPEFAYDKSPFEIKSLQEPPIQRTEKFSAMIPFDTAPDAAPLVPYNENSNDPLFQTYSKLEALSELGSVPDSVREDKQTEQTGKVEWRGTPVTIGDAPIFLGRLLQYYILVSIDDLQHDALITYLNRPGVAEAGLEPPDGQIYPDDKLSRMLDNNKFDRPFLYRPNVGRIQRMKLPKGTIIEFKETGHPPGKQFVVLRRPDHFSVEFQVETFAGFGAGNLPKGFVTAHAKTTMMWPFFVTMRYSIDHPDDRSFNPRRYADWLDMLYEAISKRLEAPK